MSKYLASCVAFLLILLCHTDVITACSCAHQEVCEAFSQTPVVFVGRVTSVKEEKAEFTRFGVQETIRTGLTAHFVIEEALKGITQSEVDLVTGGGGGDCGYYFKEGETYLVYAYPNRRGDGEDVNRVSSTHLAGSGVKVIPNSLTTSICTRTRPLKFAQDDLALIRATLTGKPENRIFGMVSERVEQFSETGVTIPKYLGPMTGVTIKAIGTNASYETQTDADGWFRLINLKPGKYQFKLVMPEQHAMLYDWIKSEFEVEVPSGCFASELDFDLQIDGRIGGRVLTRNGNSVGKGVQVSLIAADDVNKELSTVLKIHEYTDRDGYYLFEGIPAGRYVLGVCIADIPAPHTPFPKTYFPGVSQPDDAQVIILQKGQHLNEFDFKLPLRYSQVVITGIVTDASGKPVPNVDVDLYDLEDPTSSVFGIEVKTDKQGRFSLRGFKGRRYHIHAWKDKDYFEGTGIQAEPIEVDTNRPVRPVTLTLNRKGIFIHQLQKDQKEKK